MLAASSVAPEIREPQRLDGELRIGTLREGILRRTGDHRQFGSPPAGLHPTPVLLTRMEIQLCPGKSRPSGKRALYRLCNRNHWHLAHRPCGFDGQFLHPAVVHRWSGITALGLQRAEQSGFCGRLVFAADSRSEVAAKGCFRGVGREPAIHGMNGERLGSEFQAGATRSRRGPPNSVSRQSARRALRAGAARVKSTRFRREHDTRFRRALRAAAARATSGFLSLPLPPPSPSTLSPSRSPWTSGWTSKLAHAFGAFGSHSFLQGPRSGHHAACVTVVRGVRRAVRGAHALACVCGGGVRGRGGGGGPGIWHMSGTCRSARAGSPNAKFMPASHACAGACRL